MDLIGKNIKTHLVKVGITEYPNNNLKSHGKKVCPNQPRDFAYEDNFSSYYKFHPMIVKEKDIYKAYDHLNGKELWESEFEIKEIKIWGLLYYEDENNRQFYRTAEGDEFKLPKGFEICDRRENFMLLSKGSKKAVFNLKTSKITKTVEGDYSFDTNFIFSKYENKTCSLYCGLTGQKIFESKKPNGIYWNGIFMIHGELFSPPHDVYKLVRELDIQPEVPKQPEQVEECCVCYEELDKRTHVFPGCGHTTICGECANILDSCPICRQPSKPIRLFFVINMINMIKLKAYLL